MSPEYVSLDAKSNISSPQQVLSFTFFAQIYPKQPIIYRRYLCTDEYAWLADLIAREPTVVTRTNLIFIKSLVHRNKRNTAICVRAASNLCNGSEIRWRWERTRRQTPCWAKVPTSTDETGTGSKCLRCAQSKASGADSARVAMHCRFWKRVRFVRDSSPLSSPRG